MLVDGVVVPVTLRVAKTEEVAVTVTVFVSEDETCLVMDRVSFNVCDNVRINDEV